MASVRRSDQTGLSTHHQVEEKGKNTSPGEQKVKDVATQLLQKTPPPVPPKKGSFQASASKIPSSPKADRVAKQQLGALAPAKGATFNEASIMKQLKTLPSMNEGQIRAFAADLSLHLSTLPQDQQEGAKALLTTIKSLHNPKTFAVSREGDQVIRNVGKTLEALGVTRSGFDESKKQVKKEMRQELKQFLGSYSGSLKGLTQVVTEQITRMHDAIIPRVLKAATSEGKEVPEAFLSKLVENTRGLTAFKQGAQNYFESRWEKDLRHIDKHYEGTPSNILNKLGGDISPLNDLQEKETDDKLATTFLKLATPPDEAQKKEIYSDLYKQSRESRKDILTWVATHATHIKQVYRQGNEEHTNLGTGVCFANSLERYRFLLENPTLPSETISMGSSEKGRIQQKWFREEFKSTEGNLEKKAQASQKFYAKMGLTAGRFEAVSHPSALQKQLDKFNREGVSLFVIMLQGELKSGHAFNVQYDPANGIFRFMDDNLGVIECPDGKTLAQTLGSWLEKNYANLPNVTLLTYKAST